MNRGLWGRTAAVAFASLALLTVIGAVGGCKPHAGATCSANQVSCSDDKAGLFCGADGTFHAMTCSGPAGCTQSGSEVSCDNGIAKAGDGCNTEDDAACSVDHNSALLCRAGVFVVAETCHGPGACQVTGDTITCDNDVSEIGDPCRTAGDFACTGDRGSVLRCESNKMAVLNTCRGPKACSINNHVAENKVEFVCDDSIAKEGDACDTNGEEACAMDKKAILVCSANKFGKPRPCPGPKGCTYDEAGDRYACDDGSESSADAGAEAGAPLSPRAPPAPNAGSKAKH